MLHRRDLLKSFAGGALFARAAATPWHAEVLHYLESLKKSDGGYGWHGDVDSHLTPTFFVIGTYQLLKAEPPGPAQLAEWVRTHNPLPKRRYTDRPLRRFWFEQVQALLWLGHDPGSFREEIAAFTGPIDFTTAYELGGNPVFQQEAMALRCRDLLKLPPTGQWRTYILARRRPDGTFNNTPASDGSGGHILNTLWGVQALLALGEGKAAAGDVAEFVRECQLPSGGYTYAPKAELGAIDDVAYTWAALKLLRMAGASMTNPRALQYLSSLWNQDGGFGDRPHRRSNPMATYYAVEALTLLGSAPQGPRTINERPAPPPPDLRVFTIQIEAPGKGSPSEAVELARSLRIDLWAAKNADPEWIATAQRIADERKVPVRFCIGDEEYGTYVSVPGLGTYSHLADLVAPAGKDIGKPMAGKIPHPWTQFRDRRIRDLKSGGGRMIWQFNENEELTRVLLDEAVERGTYAAISSYHFGNENFLNTQPFLMRYKDVLPFIALQDSHASESWWWGDQLEGFRTVYLALDNRWESWLAALADNRVMSIRHDAITNFETRYAGADRVRSAVTEWWGANRSKLQRPAAALTVLRPGDRFEQGVPEAGVAIRVRPLRQNSPQSLPLDAVTELVRLEVDGSAVEMRLVETKNANGKVADAYQIAEMPNIAAGRHTAAARLRKITSGETVSISHEFTV